MRLRVAAVLASIVLLFPSPAARADDVFLMVDDAGADGLVVAHVDLTSAVKWLKMDAVDPAGLQAVVVGTDTAPPFQFVPDADFDPNSRVAGTVVFQLPERNQPSDPGQSPTRLRLTFAWPGDDAEEGPPDWDGRVVTSHYVVVHDADKLGALPSRIEFPATGKVFDSLQWHDRTYDPEQGSFRLINDSQPDLALVADGPLCKVVQVAGRYARGDGTRPDSRPEAVYQWFYFHDRPVIRVAVTHRQREPFAWKEWHFLELYYSDDSFADWAGDNPAKSGTFSGLAEGPSFLNWAALLDGKNAIATLRSGRSIVYDGKGGHGCYLHAFGNLAWAGYDGTQRRLAAWLWIGSHDEPTLAIAAAADRLPTDGGLVVTVGAVRERIEAARAELESGDETLRREAWRIVHGAEQLESQGRFREAFDTLQGKPPSTWSTLTAGDLGMILRRTEGGLGLLSLCDIGRDQQILAADPLPLFEIGLRHLETGEDVTLTADAAWEQVEVEPAGQDGLVIRWEKPQDERLDPLEIVAAVTADAAAGAFRWSLEIDGVNQAWTLRQVLFPQLAVARMGPDAAVFFPRGAGEVKHDVWDRDFTCQGTYPSGWMTMQFLAAYGRGLDTGLYVAIHDPLAATKDIRFQSRPADRSAVLAFSHPAPDMGRPCNRFSLGGEAVWRLLRGDWFDASVIYRDWVRREARWFPELSPDGRADTPRWMRDLSVWVIDGGKPEECVERVKRFAEAVARPVGFHWYRWHKIPFDNDYPHYFPTQDGFTQAVAELQASGVHVMPYINGRLWDTHDGGGEDFEFAEHGLPGATKNERGEPYIETYGAKESDGQLVRLAPMCPTTDVWQSRVREIVLRLMNECGVHGVYIDQVAAAKPMLCMDESHGHLLGGGHWWNTSGYWPMMDSIRRLMPEGRMLTTECNAEPYVRWFDGYLTWHWQYDGQVPAFPAVYGGSIQMFGRAYRGGESKDLALAMKAGQQLVFGEQIGWISPGVVNEEENMAFLRQVVHLRARLIRYFNAGEMGRPPQITGEIPPVTADWRWSGVWPVTTDAVLGGTWRLPQENRTVVIVVNVSDEPVETTVEVDPATHGLIGQRLDVVRFTSDAAADATAETGSTPRVFRQLVTLPPRTARAWELRAP